MGFVWFLEVKSNYQKCASLQKDSQGHAIKILDFDRGDLGNCFFTVEF